VNLLMFPGLSVR